MDIQSTSQPKHLLSANPKEGHEKDVSKERIQSTEPELESLGAVGGEGISYAPDTERRTVAATVLPTTTLDTFAANHQKKNLLYGVHPILPSSAFTEEHLDTLSKATKDLAIYVANHLKHVAVKIVALRVQTLIIKMIRGEDSDNEIEPLIKNINKFIKKYSNAEYGNSEPILDSHTLWPIDRDDCSNPSFCAIGQSQVKEYYNGYEEYIAFAPRKKTEKERLDLRDKAEATLKKIKEFDLMSNFSPDDKRTTEEPSYIFLPEKDIKSIEANDPDLRSTGERYNVFLVSHNLTRANDFEKKLLACYNLHIDLESENCQEMPKIKPIFFLDVYQKLLSDYITSKKFTAFQIQQIACIWVMTLTKYLQFFQTLFLEKFCTRTKPKKKQDQYSILGCKRCVSLTIWAKDNGFLSLATYKTLTELSDAIMHESSKEKNNASLNTLAIEVKEYEIDAAIGREKKRRSYTDYVGLCQLLGFKEKFYKASDAASQYSFYPIIIQIWNSLGLSGINHPWITTKKLMPEYAIEYLMQMGKQKDSLLLIKEDVNAITKMLFDPSNAAKKLWMPYPILYQYIIGEEAAGRELLRDGGRYHWHIFFVFVSLVANEKLEESTSSVEKFLARDQQKLSRDEKEMRNKILPLLALVHKRLADTETCDTEKTRHLKQALLYLFTQSPAHKELYLSIAIIQEQLNDLKSAYTSYTKLEEHCKTFPKESTEHCQLQFISQAKEQLTNRMPNSPDDTPTEESALQKTDILTHRQKKRAKKRERERSQAKENTLTTSTTTQLTSDEKEIILPLASLRTDKPSGADFKIKEPAERIQNLTLKSEECVQEDNDTNWTLVRKTATLSSKIPYGITNESFELARSSTKHSHHLLSIKLLHSANIDYDDLWSEHSRLYEKTDNITLKQMIFQNKIWSIRHKTFNILALDYESNQNNIPVDNIKTKLRADILKSLYSNIENVIKTLTSETLPETWRNNPEIIFTLKNFSLFLGTSAPLRFRIQFGGQCSTMAHVMRDIVSDLPNEDANMEYALSIFDRTNLDDFYHLATLFYNFRDRINPEHSSNQAINY